MKLLLDECLPKQLKNNLPGHECQTVPEVGWEGKKNGELLRLAEAVGFEVFLTIDRGIEFEQNLSQHRVAVILLRAKSNRLADLLPHVPEILRVVHCIQAGQLVRVAG